MRIAEADLRRSGFDLQASALKRTQSDLLALSGQFTSPGIDQQKIGMEGLHYGHMPVYLGHVPVMGAGSGLAIGGFGPAWGRDLEDRNHAVDP
jgi:hypothetical protein